MRDIFILEYVCTEHQCWALGSNGIPKMGWNFWALQGSLVSNPIHDIERWTSIPIIFPSSLAVHKTDAVALRAYLKPWSGHETAYIHVCVYFGALLVVGGQEVKKRGGGMYRKRRNVEYENYIKSMALDLQCTCT